MKRKTADAIATTAKANSHRNLAIGSLLTLGLAFGATWVFADENITVAHGFSNFGDLKYAADFKHLDYVNPDAPKGGEISQAAIGNFDSFNNYSRKGVSAAPIGLFESLLVATADDAYGTYCYMCTTLEFPESRDWVIFNLRDDVTFRDGTPMTAEDVKFSFEVFLTQGLPEYVAVIEGFVDSVEILGDYKIKFNFAEDAPRREVLGFAGGTTVFSKKWFEETGARIDESTLEPYMGTGPYQIDSFDVGRQIIYGRNPNFWGAEHPMNVGQNNFDNIRIEYFADSSAAFEAFKAGEFTFRLENSSKTWATGYDFPALNDGYVKREALPDGTIGSAQSWVFNLDEENWQDKKTREAVRSMFNFDWSNEALFYGLYERVNSFWENSPLEATGMPTEGEIALLQPLVDEGLVDASILSSEPVLAPSNDPAQNTPERRVRRNAIGLLEEAGWVVADDGMVRKDGETLDLTVLTYSPLFDRIVNPFVENLKSIGVNAKMERVDVSQYIDRRRSGDFDLVNQTFSMGFEPGFGLRQWYGSETADDSSRNLMRLRNPAVDRLVTSVIEAETLEDLTTSVHALDRVLRAEGFWVQQWFKNTHTVAYYDQYKYPDPLPPFSLGHIGFWWYDEEGAQRLKDAGAL